MLTIDRLVLHLPAELRGRERALGRALGTAFAGYRPARSLTAARLGAVLHDVSPTMNDAAIAAAIVRAVGTRVDGHAGGAGNERAP
jgi:hypothetical protein